MIHWKNILDMNNVIAADSHHIHEIIIDNPSKNI